MTSVADRLRAALTSYALEREIGRGGMATVYLARDLKHHRNVAVKVLRPELASAIGPDRFQREILTVASLTHPHILPLHDSGESDGFLYYVMPFVEGESLRDRLEREQQLPLDDALRIAGEVADALDYAHSQGIVHRDIKPENILFEAGHAVVTDFGIARVMASSEVDSFTGPGAAVGTVAYMSPEQAAGSKVLDGRSDQYALGCVLYEMLAGDPPFSASSAQALIARKLNDSLPRISIVRPTVPPHIEAAINRATERVAADRYRSMGELAEALKRPPPPEPPEVARVDPARRRRSVRVAAGALLALGLFFLIWKGISSVIEAATRTRYPEVPTWSAWRGWGGEFFPVFAATDSLLFAQVLGGNALQAFDGERWTTIAVPDSIQLLPHVGSLGAPRLLATTSVKDSSGNPALAFWWMNLAGNGLQLSRVDAELRPDYGMRGSWWSDSANLVLRQDAIRRLEGRAWLREATGASSGITTLWGRDLRHRFAISGAADSLLIFDGINWTVSGIGEGDPGTTTALRKGTTFADSTTVVVGEQCSGDSSCQSLIVRQEGYGRPWRRVAIPRSAGIPLATPSLASDGCDPARFALSDVAGKDRDEFFIWGFWATCDGGVRPHLTLGCPSQYPCVWEVKRGRIQPVSDLAGQVVITVFYLKGIPFALLDDGTIRRRAGREWLPVTQVPGLPNRRIAVSDRVIIRESGGPIRYEPGQRDTASSAIVAALEGMPSPDPGVRSMVARDSSIAILFSDGSVSLSRCHTRRISTQNVGPASAMGCDPLEPVRAGRDDVRALAFVDAATLVGVGQHGFAFSWHDGVPRIETLPAAARDDDFWQVVPTTEGKAVAVGQYVVIERDPSGRWTVVRRNATAAGSAQGFAALSDGDLVIADRAIQVFDRSPDSVPVARVYRQELGESRLTLHVLRDGRLVAGVGNSDDPIVGGHLLVWAPPVRQNRWQEVRLPITVDITDIDDDGRFLYVVGRGGSLQIPLDSLPFAPPAD
jgi:tRNA A-37 threonylcarbamoyl transferase component Bud32